jgi:hypothetical protein
VKVKIRHFEEADSVDFCEIRSPFESALKDLILFIKQSGGVYNEGDHEDFHSYQLVLEHGEAFVEILIGEEE